MNYSIFSYAVVLFALLYELSGAEDFVPPSQRSSVAEAAPEQIFDRRFAQVYVPFDAPVIIPAPAPTERTIQRADNLPDGFAIVQASVQQPAAEARADIRIVAGSRVNMREGPGTDFEVIDTLPRGVEAEVLFVDDTDWAQIRLLESDRTGWMAAWLLSD